MCAHIYKVLMHAIPQNKVNRIQNFPIPEGLYAHYLIIIAEWPVIIFINVTILAALLFSDEIS